MPFLDHPLVELTMNLPMELKVRGVLSDDVIDRSKMGFAAAMVEWRFFERFPVSRQRVVEMLDRHREGRSDFALYVWTTYDAVAGFDNPCEVHVA